MTTLVFADAARTGGRVAFDLLLLAATVAVFIGWRRRRQRGERATAWLVAFVVMCVLVLGMVANAAQAPPG